MTEHTLPELLPCPFCGGEAELITTAPECFVRCVNDHCCPGRNLPETAVKDWNVRAPVQATQGDKCPECKGNGWIVGVEAVCCGNVYDSGECRSHCPVQEQVQQQCERCGGAGRFPLAEQPDIGAMLEALISLSPEHLPDTCAELPDSSYKTPEFALHAREHNRGFNLAAALYRKRIRDYFSKTAAQAMEGQTK